jgi:hypothetical protein
MKKQFELSDDEFNELMEIAKNPTPYMLGSGGVELFESTQDRANRVWKRIGKEKGFVWDSCESAGSNPKLFMATPL